MGVQKAVKNVNTMLTEYNRRSKYIESGAD